MLRVHSSGAGKILLQPCLDSIRIGIAVVLQQFGNFGPGWDNYGMLILLDFSIRLNVHVAGRYKDTKLTMTQAGD